MARDESALKPLSSASQQSSQYITEANENGNSARFVGKSPKRQSKLAGMTAFETAGREKVWLWDFRQGMSTNAIASRDGVSVRRVRFGVSRAGAYERGVSKISKDRLPWLVPLFPLGPYTPRSSCGHQRPIASGSVLCCMICHRSGWDKHPAMQRDPETDPAPEPRLTSLYQERAQETRRGRRQQLFGERE